MTRPRDLTRYLRHPLQAVDRRMDDLVRSARHRLGYVNPAIIVPYRTYGTERQLRVRGRVIEDKSIDDAPRSESLRHNFRVTLKRVNSDEVPGAEVEWRLADRAGLVTTDPEGFFELTLEADFPPADAGSRWREIELALKRPLLAGQSEAVARAQVLTPPADAQYGIISDIDDTIIVTGATNFLKNWRRVIAASAKARVGFPGLASFYRALERGTAGVPVNPVFYVSSSPWNLYDLLEDFLELHGIPLGPLLLRDFGLDSSKWFTGSHEGHKVEQVDNIFRTYPHLSFILIGDSGQHDVEIYSEVVRRHGSRVRAVYIRDVSHDRRDTQAKRLLDAVRAQTRVAYGPDLVEAAEDAASVGWIPATAAREVRAAVARHRDEERS